MQVLKLKLLKSEIRTDTIERNELLNSHWSFLGPLDLANMPSRSFRKETPGFSLIELMIVVTIIGIIAIFTVPDFMKWRSLANEKSAISSLQILLTAENIYASNSGDGSFGTLQDLMKIGVIDAALGSGTKDGYNLLLITDGKAGFTVTLVPIAIGTSGQRGFYSDETGVIRYSSDGSPPTKKSPPLKTGSEE